jgi:hypothetical protein
MGVQMPGARFARELPAGTRRFQMAAEMEDFMDDSKPVDQPSKETVKVRQGTGPRATVSVLMISTALALTAGAILLVYFFARSGA